MFGRHRFPFLFMIYGTATGEGLHFVAMGVVIPW